MLFKLFVVVMMLIILFCLGSGLIYLVRDKGKTDRTVKALSWRIGLSLTLFILLFVAFAMGWIQPHGIG
ncbi:MAG: twin transmembrane helix small protein [Gammaproteobacteria bacterium]